MIWATGIVLLMPFSNPIIMLIIVAPPVEILWPVAELRNLTLRRNVLLRLHHTDDLLIVSV